MTDSTGGHVPDSGESFVGPVDGCGRFVRVDGSLEKEGPWSDQNPPNYLNTWPYPSEHVSRRDRSLSATDEAFVVWRGGKDRSESRIKGVCRKGVTGWEWDWGKIFNTHNLNSSMFSYNHTYNVSEYYTTCGTWCTSKTTSTWSSSRNFRGRTGGRDGG